VSAADDDGDDVDSEDDDSRVDAGTSESCVDP